MNIVEEQGIKQICQNILDSKIEYWMSEPIDGVHRYQIHNMVETIDEFNNLMTRTICVEGICGKKKIMMEKKVSDNNICDESNLLNAHQINEITTEQIDLFVKYSKIPIPINLPEHINYYISLLFPYYNINSYNDFISDINKLGFHKIKVDILFVKNKVINKLKSNDEYQNFISSKTIISKYPKDFITQSKSIYNSTNVGKNLISIDIKSANWTCYKKITQMDMNIQWYDMINKFTPSKFICKSKYLREVIFGEINSKKLIKFTGDFLFDLDQVISLQYPNIKKITCLTDEIIYEIMYIDGFNFDEFISKIKVVDENFNSIYRVEQFKLKQFLPYDYYVKEITQSSDFVDCTNKSFLVPVQVQFKQIPKHYICQAIKYYQDKQPEQLDMKFMFENIPCSFDTKLCFDKII
jgi:hypothetical protein